MVDMVLTAAKVICVAKAAIRFNERLWVSEFECANFWKHFAQHSTVYVEIRDQAMTDLTKQLEEALIPMHPNDRIRFADMSYGIQCHADRLAPLHASLLKCVEALDEITEVVGTSTLQHKIASKAIADLRKALEECK